MVTELPKQEPVTEESEENIFVRDADTLSWANEPVVYEFTQDRALLHQYYQLREHMYRKVHNVERFSGKEDVYDKISHVLIARKGRLCIGGCRLTVRESDEDFLLPMESESDGFFMRDELPQFHLDEIKHAEISRFAVMHGHDEREVMRQLCKITCEKAIALGMEAVFAKSPRTLARNWRLIAKRECNLRARILDNIEIPVNPDYPEIKWYLTAFEDPNNPVDQTAKEAKTKKHDTLVH